MEDSRSATSETYTVLVETAAMATPTVKLLTLRPDRPGLSFRAGQWIDAMLPGVSTIGGYSIASCPTDFASSGQMLVAVKHSNHEPARWVHDNCHAGSSFDLRVGGSVFLDLSHPRVSAAPSFLFVAGGIGISPLFGMVAELARQRPTARVHVLFSAKNAEELLFLDEMAAICAAHSGWAVEAFLTAPTAVLPESPPPAVIYRAGRLSTEALSRHLQTLGLESTEVYVCGPPALSDSVLAMLGDLGVASSQVHFERWW